MPQHLLPLIVTFFLLSWLIENRHYLHIWITYRRSRPNISKRKGKDKSLPHLFPTKKPDCPLCQAEEMLPSEVIPEPPPLIAHTLGRPRSIYTDLHYCPNSGCKYYGWLARGNICSNGHPNSSIWLQLKCIYCGKYFTETLGTPFYRSKTQPKTIISALKALAEGLSIQATARVLDVDSDTVQDWLSQAAEHMEAISRYLIHELHLSQVQVDEMWSLLGERDELAPQKRNTRWIWSAIDPQSKLWLGFLIADRSLEAAQVFIHQSVTWEEKMRI